MHTVFKSNYHCFSLVNKIQLLLVLIIFSSTIGCKKEETPLIQIPIFDSILDVDSNYYKIVKIGNQWWMADDLKVKTYNDGTPIRYAESIEFWIENTPAFCQYNNDPNAPGLLYNWYVINDIKKIAPVGWHIATESDWQALELQLGISNDKINEIGWRGEKQGSDLKVYGRKAWLTDIEHWPNNASGFSATAGSCRLANGTWGDPGLFHTGFWWTATEKDVKKAFYRHLDYNHNQVFRNYNYKSNGYSVRCVKD